jgi:hypothetical protein
VVRKPKETLMLTMLWNLSTAIRGYLRCYMPTNRAIDWLRGPRGLKWAIPVALIATPAYLGLTVLAIQGAARPGFGWLNALVFLCYWNASKFAWITVFSSAQLLRLAVRFGGSAVGAGSAVAGFEVRRAGLRYPSDLSAERTGPFRLKPPCVT